MIDILVDELEGSLWVATIQNNKLLGVEIDPAEEEVRWGSIYLGRVTRIDKSMDAAFILLDEDGNTGILHNADTHIIDELGQIKKGGSDAIGKTLSPGQMIVVQAKSGYLPRPYDDDLGLLHEDKNVKLSMDITLPGRHLIHSPFMAENRISKRIHDTKQRKQLMQMLDNVQNIQGCILRASAANTQTDVLIRESKILKEVWNQLQNFFKGTSPQLIMQGPDALQRTLGDYAHETIKTVEIVTMEQYQEVEEWCEIYAPDLVTKVTPVELPDQEMDLGLFEYRDILDSIEALFHPYVILASGGNLIIQETAALCAVDVNRGADNRPSLDVNLEAIKEISRQIRLRNIGGIIVIDLLKMKGKKEKDAILKALKTIPHDDPCTLQIHGLTNLGLVEMTRNRRTPALQDRLDLALD